MSKTVQSTSSNSYAGVLKTGNRLVDRIADSKSVLPDLGARVTALLSELPSDSMPQELYDLIMDLERVMKRAGYPQVTLVTAMIAAQNALTRKELDSLAADMQKMSDYINQEHERGLAILAQAKKQTDDAIAANNVKEREISDETYVSKADLQDAVSTMVAQQLATQADIAPQHNQARTVPSMDAPPGFDDQLPKLFLRDGRTGAITQVVGRQLENLVKKQAKQLLCVVGPSQYESYFG
jgi:hypothetical protein